MPNDAASGGPVEEGARLISAWRQAVEGEAAAAPARRVVELALRFRRCPGRDDRDPVVLVSGKAGELHHRRFEGGIGGLRGPDALPCPD